jgi:hypothetical protein
MVGNQDSTFKNNQYRIFNNQYPTIIPLEHPFKIQDSKYSAEFQDHGYQGNN